MFPLHEILSHLSRLTADLARQAVWKAVARLPWAILSSSFLCVLTGGVSWWLVAGRAGGVSAELAALFWLAAFGSAGLLWGLHRAVHGGAEAGLMILREQTPGLVRCVLTPLRERLPVSRAEYSIAEVREHWEALTGELVPVPIEARWYRPLARVGNWLTKRWIDAQVVIVRQMFAEMESRGATHLSAETLEQYAAHRSAAVACQALRHNLRLINWGTAAVVFVLMVLPPAVACLASRL